MIKVLAGLLFFAGTTNAQLNWVRVDSLFGNLPASLKVFKTTDPLDGKPNIAYYAEVDMNDRSLELTVDTGYKRRLKPAEFYEKNNHPLLTVNCTFFNFDKNQNLNTVIRKGELLGYNVHSLPARGKDTFTYHHPFCAALGISKNRKADVAWLYTDSAKRFPYAFQSPVDHYRDSNQFIIFADLKRKYQPRKWKVQTAIGGGPALLQDGEIRISNNEEMKFSGKAINDKHPRTAMGYTTGGKLIILVIQGRFPNTAEGATLVQEAQILKDLDCTEALNLDGGGSSCLLINGIETIKPSDKEGQRPTPAVFIVNKSR